MLELNPSEDGITHINVYSKGKTELGSLLSNFSHTPFTHPHDGKFQSVEGYWYWVKFGKRIDDFRELVGNDAKNLAKYILDELVKELGSNPLEAFNEEEIESIRTALKCKVYQTPHLKSIMKESTLPFVHYYCWYSKKDPSVYKIHKKDNHPWLMEELESIREGLKSNS